jgi:hypothetical protein
LADKQESRNETCRSATEDPNRLYNSVLNLPTYVCNGEKVPLEVLELVTSNQNLYTVLLQNYPSLLASSRSFSDSGRLHDSRQFVTNRTAPPSPLVIIPHPSIRRQSSVTYHDRKTDKELPKNATTEEAYLCWLKKTQHHHNCHHHSSRRSSSSYIRDLKFHR